MFVWFSQHSPNVLLTFEFWVYLENLWRTFPFCSPNISLERTFSKYIYIFPQSLTVLLVRNYTSSWKPKSYQKRVQQWAEKEKSWWLRLTLLRFFFYPPGSYKLIKTKSLKIKSAWTTNKGFLIVSRYNYYSILFLLSLAWSALSNVINDLKNVLQSSWSAVMQMVGSD